MAGDPALRAVMHRLEVVSCAGQVQDEAELVTRVVFQTYG